MSERHVHIEEYARRMAERHQTYSALGAVVDEIVEHELQRYCEDVQRTDTLLGSIVSTAADERWALFRELEPMLLETYKDQQYWLEHIDAQTYSD
jgi:hypothetical protein